MIFPRILPLSRVVVPFFFVSTLFLNLLATRAMGSDPAADIGSQTPKYEFRSSWVTTAWGLDWPKSTVAATQRSQMIRILDQLASQNMNAIVFQVSARGDAYYRSDRLPWAYNLTGTPGRDPGWDPLQFVIDEARARGLEVHAWFNPFAVAYDSGNDSPASAAIPNVRFTNPAWMESGGWMNPGYPEAREWQVANVLELIENYDIDAIHFDRIRYAGAYPSDATLMAAHNPDNISNIADWRRNNVTEFIRLVHEGVKEIRPTVKIGVTPIGHYDHGSTNGWGAQYGYSSVFQDSRYWAEMGYIDYIAPQVYWDIGTQEPPRFAFIVRDWVNKRRNNRHLYIGIGPYKNGTGQFAHINIRAEMHDQIDSTRTAGAEGQIYFRNDNIAASDFSGRYEYKAIVPPMPWRSMTQPNRVRNLAYSREGDQVHLTWDKPDTGRGEDDPLFRYVIYKSGETDILNPANIISNPENIIEITGENHFTDDLPLHDDGDILAESPGATYFVTALSRNNVESDFEKMEIIPVSADDPAMAAASYSLSQNYPNPFNPATNITFMLPGAEQVSLQVFDVTGRLVAVLLDERRSAGSHTVSWDASGMASGVYMYRIMAGGFVKTKPMVLLK